MTRLRRLFRRRRRLAPEDPATRTRSVELARELRTHARRLNDIANELAELHGLDRRVIAQVPHPARRIGDNPTS